VKEELMKGLDVVKLPVYPEMKEVDWGACKGNIPYYSFIAKEAVTALKEYLAERVLEYGSVEDGEPLFCSTSTNYPAKLRRKTPIKIRTLQVQVKRAARQAGISGWKWITPHCLRKAFESALRNGGLDVKDQEFLMGHILPGSQDTYYDKSQSDQLKVKYARVRFFRTNELDKVEMIKSFARSLGIGNIEVKIAKLRTADPTVGEEDAIGRIVREELITPLRIEMSKQRTGNEDPKKIVSENELEQYLVDGWDVQTVLPSGKILIRK
jgi:hypothetical protein